MFLFMTERSVLRAMMIFYLSELQDKPIFFFDGGAFSTITVPLMVVFVALPRYGVPRIALAEPKG